MIDKMKVYQDTELSSKAVSVYLYLCERASKETKSCYPSMKTIAKDLHLSLASVKRSIQELERSAYIKKEETNRRNFRTYRDLYHSVFQYIEGFYNSRRPHGSLGYLIPDEMETTFWERQGI